MLPVVMLPVRLDCIDSTRKRFVREIRRAGSSGCRQSKQESLWATETGGLHDWMLPAMLPAKLPARLDCTDSTSRTCLSESMWEGSGRVGTRYAQ